MDFSDELVNAEIILIWEITSNVKQCENQTYNVSLKNNTMQTLSPNLFLALKSNDGKYEYIYIDQIDIERKGNVTKNLDVENAAEAKLYVWSNELRPYSSVINVK